MTYAAKILHNKGDYYMFGKKKAEENKYIIAVKDYGNTVKAVREGSLLLPYGSEIYLKMFETADNKADSMNDIKKFIKSTNKSEKDVKHFWEGLIEQGFTLLSVRYEQKLPTMEQLCSKDILRYIGSV